jgi:hypothetical protein
MQTLSSMFRTWKTASATVKAAATSTRGGLHWNTSEEGWWMVATTVRPFSASFRRLLITPNADALSSPLTVTTFAQ